MTILPMYKRCPRCGGKYSYNPSVGDMGLFCPYCAKLAFPPLTEVISEIGRFIERIF
ncbi:hypothetical protein FACS1894216_20010 [Synergistales bacterium]|nr:hypothetical protein FACS1894216_20010 [Synergistales bacterium]